MYEYPIREVADPAAEKIIQRERGKVAQLKSSILQRLQALRGRVKSTRDLERAIAFVEAKQFDSAGGPLSNLVVFEDDPQVSVEANSISDLVIAAASKVVGIRSIGG